MSENSIGEKIVSENNYAALLISGLNIWISYAYCWKQNRADVRGVSMLDCILKNSFNLFRHDFSIGRFAVHFSKTFADNADTKQAERKTRYTHEYSK